MRPATPTTVRTEDLLRHLGDLRTGTYEGVADRPGREDLYRRAVELAEPVAVSVLRAAAEAFLDGDADVRTVPVGDDGAGGLSASFELSWPAQRAARVRRGPDRPLEPVRIVVRFRRDFLHPHLSGTALGDWPFQVVSAEDAERQAPVFAAIVEAELHQRVFEAGWQVLPAAGRPGPGRG
jgi:hypothetical protein